MERFTDYLRSQEILGVTQHLLQTVFYEVATNIRLHAGLKPEQSARLQVSVQTSKVVLTFIDPGVPFDVTQFDVSSPDVTMSGYDSRPHFGIPMIRRFADKVSYIRHDGTTNVLNLELERR
jgi:anti-sigma regulatory factor (Ser/Thr protein kinase)